MYEALPGAEYINTRKSDALVKSADPADHGFPDHYPVFIQTTVKKTPPPTKSVSYQKIKAVEVSSFIDAIVESSLATNNEETPLNSAVEIYNVEMCNIMDRLAPVKTRTVTIRHDSEWYDDSVREAKQQRRRAERKWRKSGLMTDRVLFIEQREHVNRLIETTKQSYYQNLIRNCNGPKAVFSTVKKLLGKGKSSTLPTQGSAAELASLFSEFFVQKIQNIRESIPDTDDPMPPQPPVSSSFSEFRQIDDDYTLKLIMQSSTKSCKLDPIPTELLKKCAATLCPFITCIVNRSLSDGIFPDVFKTALLRPLIKKPDLDCEQMKNYRPVSNLSFISKIIERAAVDQLTSYLEMTDYSYTGSRFSE